MYHGEADQVDAAVEMLWAIIGVSFRVIHNPGHEILAHRQQALNRFARALASNDRPLLMSMRYLTVSTMNRSLALMSSNANLRAHFQGHQAVRNCRVTAS